MNNYSTNRILLIISIIFSPIALFLIASQLFSFGLGEANDVQFIISSVTAIISVIIGIVLWVKTWKKNKLQGGQGLLLASILTVVFLEVIPYLTHVFAFNQ